MSEEEKASAFRESKDCLVPKTTAGITWGVIAIILIASVSGIGIYYLSDYLNRQHQTRLDVTINNFYLHLYKNNTELGIDSDYEIGALGFYFMVFDKVIWNTLKEYDNASDYEQHVNETTNKLIGTFVAMQFIQWGDMNGMIDNGDGNSSVNNIDNRSKVGIDNTMKTFTWGKDKVVILVGIGLLVYNRTTTTMNTINISPFDIMGESLNDTFEENLDIVNFTKAYENLAYFPNNIYTLTILGADYDITTHDASKLYVKIDGVDATITDRDLTMFI